MLLNNIYGLAISICIVALMTVTLKSNAQAATNEMIASALTEQTSNFPSLGMKVLSIKGNKHVLMSKNGRYIITGTLQDLWEGVERSFVEINPVNYTSAAKVFEFIDRKDLSINFGNSRGTPLDIFVSYSCKQCKQFIKQVMKEEFIAKFNINIFVVYANNLDKKIAEDVFCSLDAKATFIKRFINRNISNLNTACSPKEPKLSIAYANILPVRSLPATLSHSKKLYYGALPETF